MNLKLNHQKFMTEEKREEKRLADVMEDKKLRKMQHECDAFIAQAQGYINDMRRSSGIY